jgi:hypothetical protein
MKERNEGFRHGGGRGQIGMLSNSSETFMKFYKIFFEPSSTENAPF